MTKIKTGQNSAVSAPVVKCPDPRIASRNMRTASPAYLYRAAQAKRRAVQEERFRKRQEARGLSVTEQVTSLWHALTQKTAKVQAAFDNCLLYLCRSINCQQFLKQSKALGFDASEWRIDYLLQWKYYVTLRLHTFNRLLNLKTPPSKSTAASTQDSSVELAEFTVSKADDQAIERSLNNPKLRKQLESRFAEQGNIAYKEQEVSKHIALTLPTLRNAAALIVRSKLRFLRTFNGLLFEDLEHDLLSHAVQNLGWSYDRRPIEESVLLGCKIMHNKAANVASFYSAKKRSCASPKNAQGFSSVIIVRDTDKAANLIAQIPDEQSSVYVEENRFDLDRAVQILAKNKRRRKLLKLLTKEENPEFEKWLKSEKVIRGKQTDRHLFLKNPRMFFMLAARYVGFTMKQTQKLLFLLSGETA